ncbi:oocyte zinc finger protein XlCOF6-like [Microplitis mediator]|uniref:oocyte zinc finger protein XlCOF6-like n=1 Tax=Microplitis mediator TaxID=375433 RepID=UPI0025531BE2|nr:oocyte zinc finger protein XlCOF6-like [Microplitis mediator]
MSTPPEIVDITSDSEANASHVENQDEEVVLVYEAVAKKHSGNNVLNSLFALTNQCHLNNNGLPVISAQQRMKIWGECFILNRIAMQNMQALTNMAECFLTTSTATISTTGRTGSNNDNDKNKVKLEELQNNLETINKLINENNSQNKDEDQANDVIEELVVKDQENYSTDNDCSEVNLVPVVNNDNSKDDKNDFVVLNDGASGPSNLQVQVDEVVDNSNAGTAHEKNTEPVNPITESDQTGNSHDINRHIHHHRHQSENKKSISCSTEKELECLFCRKIFTSKKTLMLHLETHKKDDNYYCNVCLYTTKFLWTFKNHMNQHINAGLFICYECGDSFVNKSLIKKHLKSHHKSKFRNSNRYRRSKSSKRLTEECPFCKKKFLSKHNLELHKKTHKKKNHFYCNVCLYKTKSTRNFVSHSNKHMNDELCVCYHCGNSYKIKASLEDHLNSHRDPNSQFINHHNAISFRNKNLVCLFCQIKFPDIESLEQHRKTHKKGSTYYCNLCLYTTTVLNYFYKHTKKHFNDNSYTCYHCGKSFKKKKSIEFHLNFHRDPKYQFINHHNARSLVNKKLVCLVSQKQISRH